MDDASDSGTASPASDIGEDFAEEVYARGTRRRSRRRLSSTTLRASSRSAPGERKYTAAKRRLLSAMRRDGQATRRGKINSAATGVGSKYEVFFGLKRFTPGRLQASDLLLVRKTGKVVSALKYANGQKRYREMMRDPAFKDEWNSHKK